MAVQDKTDFRWDGRMAGTPNLLYYDLLNVDVVHTPYSTTHRNSSFFLKTRLGYQIEQKWNNNPATDGYSVYDAEVIWDNKCDEESGKVVMLGVKGHDKRIFVGNVEDGCITWIGTNVALEGGIENCGDYKLFRTSFVKGMEHRAIIDGSSVGDEYTGVQLNKYTLGTTVGMFEDTNEENGKYNFNNVSVGDYLLVYESLNRTSSGFSGQVRMVTGFEKPEKGSQRIILDSPWLGFKTPLSEEFGEDEEKILRGDGLNYMFFKERGEVIGFSNKREINILYDIDGGQVVTPYKHTGTKYADETEIIGVADANDKIFVLTDNGYIHYSDGYGYNKFFINDDMFAGTDKTSIASYRNTVLAFGRNDISIGAPDDNNVYWRMYTQSSSIGIWSRYAYAEYEGELMFISNDKRLMALRAPDSSSSYGLTMEDRGEAINSKLSTMLPTDDAYIGNYDNELRIFINTKRTPFSADESEDIHADRIRSGKNDTTHIYKHNTMFKVWTEDHIDGINIYGAGGNILYGENGIYIRDGYGVDIEGNGQEHPYKTIINAYLIENENNGMDSQPNLFLLAKLNRLITTLGWGYYTNNTRLHIISYWGGFGVDYEAPIPLDNKRLENVSRAYLGQDVEISECQMSAIQDSQNPYIATNTNKVVEYRHLIPKAIWCDSYEDMDIQNHNVKINDKVYRMAPTMPLVTSLGENQNYSTQIKIELISEGGDVISFGGFLAELFIAPIGLTGPDGEYERKLESSC